MMSRGRLDARLPTPAAPRVGGFSLARPADGDEPRWSWTDGMFVIHGFAPGEVHPTLDLMLSHVVDHDRAAVQRAIEHATEKAAVFVYGFRDARARERRCVLV